MKLLIVEDEPITRSKLAAHFEKEGYEVVCREDGNDTLDLVSEENIELCLIDINLPGKDGLTLTRELRASSDVGIILVTGKDEQIDRIVGLESGADDYVIKPFDPIEAVARYRPYMAAQLAQGARLSSMTRHMLGLFHGQPSRLEG